MRSLLTHILVKDRTTLDFFSKKNLKELSLHTGLNYSENSLEGYFNVNEVKYEFHNKIKYYSIPFLLHYDFTNLFFIRSGITIDYETEKSRSINESQSGLGALFSSGIQYTKKPFLLFNFSINKDKHIYQI